MQKNKPKKEVIPVLKAKLSILEEEIRNDVSLPVVASFGFIIALVWRDAIKSGIDEFLLRAGLTKQVYIYDLISAIIVTIVVMTLMIFVTRFSRAKKEKRIEKKIESIEDKEN